MIHYNSLRTLLATAVVTLTSLPAQSTPAPPVAASPGSTFDFASVAGRCPTFSWGSVEQAESYELAVYRVAEPTADAGSALVPVLGQSLPGSVLTWTPPLERCPKDGGRHAWAVRASIGDTSTEWSETLLFRAVEIPSPADVEEALAVLRRFVRGPTGTPAGVPAPSGAEESSRVPPSTLAPAGKRSPDGFEGAKAAEREPEDPRTMAEELLRSGSVAGSRLPATTPTPPGFYALAIEGDFELGGHVFQDGYPLLHTDGGYTYGNIALGLNALASVTPYSTGLTYGSQNAALGWKALRDTTTGSGNTAVGSSALRHNTEGSLNTAIGHSASGYNTEGTVNTAIGMLALASNTLGHASTAVGFGALVSTETDSYNTAVGYRALALSTSGSWNTAVGSKALSNTTSSNSTAVGGYALYLSTTGEDNTAIGYLALYSNTTGSDNTATGRSALLNNTEGSRNAAVGQAALLRNTTGSDNSAFGEDALHENTTGIRNTALGTNALYDSVTGDANTAVGVGALRNTSEGSGNVALGFRAGRNNTTGSNSIFIGHEGDAGDGVDSTSEVIRIGVDQDLTFVAGIAGATVNDAAVMIDTATGQLGIAASSRRFKEEIVDLGQVSQLLQKLRPVSFRYRPEVVGEGPRPLEFGLVAEEVAAVYPDLVIYDETGSPYTVRYQALTPLLLNELQRLHRLVEDMRRTRRTAPRALCEPGRPQPPLAASVPSLGGG